MKVKTNICGERICIKKECPAWFEDDTASDGIGVGCFCKARLDFFGDVRTDAVKPQYGTLCRLPIEFEIVSEPEKMSHNLEVEVEMQGGGDGSGIHDGRGECGLNGYGWGSAGGDGDADGSGWDTME